MLFLLNALMQVVSLSLYVDDMIIIGDYIDGILVLKKKLAKQFKMKDFGYL